MSDLYLATPGHTWTYLATPGHTWPHICHALLQAALRDGFAMCALQDGSSFVCPRCQGVVKISRAEQHCLYWCQAPPG